MIYRQKELTSSDLTWFTSVNGVLSDVFSITFQILFNDLEVVEAPATKFDTGSYYAEWTVPANAELGEYTIIWSWKLSNDSEVQTSENVFEILNATSGSKELAISPALYVSLEEMKSEILILTDQPSDQVLISKIKFVQKYIEKITGQFFNSRELTLDLNGSGNYLLVFPVPIISIESIEFKVSGSYYLQDLNSFQVFNRYFPDDRDYPKIESDIIFPEGSKNIRVRGIFGYTEDDGSTPGEIQAVTKMLVKLWLQDIDTVKGELRKSKVWFDKREKKETRISESISSGTLTGDAEVDNILRYFTKSVSVSCF